MQRVLGAVLIALFLTGCGTQLVYNNLPLVTPFYLDDYVDLNRDQKSVFKAGFKDLHRWHRTQELPVYRDLLIQIQATLNQPDLDPAALLAKVEPLEQRWDTLISQASPLVIEIAGTLTPEQLDGLFAAFEARNQERLDKPAAEPDEAIKRIEKWTGKLTDQQRLRIIAFERANPGLEAETVAAHRVFQARLRQVLSAPDAADFESQLSTLLANPLNSPEGRRLETLREEQGTARLVMLSELWNGASESQKRRVNRKLESYIRDFDALIDWQPAA